MDMAMLEVKNICKSFGSVSVLKGIDLSLEQGQVISIIGSSGSGKTTFLRCLNFLETADKGIISVNGNEVFNGEKREKLSDEEIAKRKAEMPLKKKEVSGYLKRYAAQVSSADKGAIINKK